MSWDAVILRLLPAAVATVTSTTVMCKYCSLCLESHSSETLLPLLTSCRRDNLIRQPI